MRTQKEHRMRGARLLPWALLVALVLVGGTVAASPRLSDTVSRVRAVLGAGASEGTAGDVVLRGTLGQPVVGTQVEGEVVLMHGFWAGGEGGDGGEHAVYLPLVLRAHR
jgi:hypothetical protein